MTETEKSAEKLKATEEFIRTFDAWIKVDYSGTELYKEMLAARAKLKELEDVQ